MSRPKVFTAFRYYGFLGPILGGKPQLDSGIQDPISGFRILYEVVFQPYLTTISQARFTCSGRYVI